MDPLRITARIEGAICIPEQAIALDALLAYAVCVRDEIPPAFTESDVRDVDIPVKRSDCARFYLASVASYEVEERERSYTNKRPVVPELQVLSPSTKRVQITAGENKGYRIHREHLYLRDDSLTWWCIGDANAIRSLLMLVHGLGKKRSVGLGVVREWTVEPCATWPGFPVMRDGAALRNLPIEYASQLACDVGFAALMPPYWLRTREVECCIPEVPR